MGSTVAPNRLVAESRIMVKIAWKVINSYGPYAYLQESVKEGSKVTSKHLAYLGSIGKAGLIPGTVLMVPSSKDFPGGRVTVPFVPDETAESLKPGALAVVQSLKSQVDAGLAKQDIVMPGQGKAGASAAKPAPQKSQASKKGKEKKPGKVAPNFQTEPAPGVADQTGEMEPNEDQGAPVAPVWKKTASAKGSTAGGIYEDQYGSKFYIKRPKSQQHVQNELLAQDLYKLAGIEVLESFGTELSGDPALASAWVEGLTGSGINPKDLLGTKEGFVPDAWLANWDSVGVGSSKYDNILNLNGKAVRVDVGGALLFRGTGGPKGSKFGNEVTELEGLRNPSLNPVAATVYGEMTPAEIQASAQAVLAIGNKAIEDAVKARFSDDPAFAKQLSDKLIARRDYIADYLQKAGEADPGTVVESTETVVDIAPLPPPSPVAPNFKAEPAGAAAPDEPAPVAAALATGGAFKLSGVPKDNKGKPLIAASNVKKLEKAAATGNPDDLQVVAEALWEKMKSPAKKAAILNAAAELKGKMLGIPTQEGDGGSGFGDAMADVASGKLDLPDQQVPSPQVVKKYRAQVKEGKKNYDADLEQIAGKKGSNEGGLFKDKTVDTLHYIKWPNSPVRAKMEALTALLYSHAGVPVPSVRTIEFQSKDAVMSDWIEGAAPMSLGEMQLHEDVRAGFAADAWLANWDVVGLAADNIVKGPGAKAYRIDLGGSMLFRAQGKGKAFPAEVDEIETLRNPSVNKEASQVFGNLSAAELAASVERVAGIGDDAIDNAVDSIELPKTSPDYPASQFGEMANDLPELVKTRLKQRRDYLAETVLHQLQKKQTEVSELKEISDLSGDSVELIADRAEGYSLTSPDAGEKWNLTEKVMVTELGPETGKLAADKVKSHYHGWKGSSNSAKGAVLRWAAGAMHGEGGTEIRRLNKFNQFLVGEGMMKEQTRKSHAKYLQEQATAEGAQNFVDGLNITREQNEVLLAMKHPGKKEVTVYRGWKPDQVKYLNLQEAPVGSMLLLDDPPLYSWSFSPKIAHSFQGGHGSFVVKATVPIDAIVLTDLTNTTGAFTGEDEVLFKGVDNFAMEVIKKQ